VSLKRVLLISPEVQLLGRLCARLNGSGAFAAETATDAFEAAAALYSSTYDCILIDPRTEGMDLLKVVRRIRGAGKLRAAPVLVLSADLEIGREAALRRAGAVTLAIDLRDMEAIVARLREATGLLQREEASGGSTTGQSAAQSKSSSQQGEAPRATRSAQTANTSRGPGRAAAPRRNDARESLAGAMRESRDGDPEQAKDAEAKSASGEAERAPTVGAKGVQPAMETKIWRRIQDDLRLPGLPPDRCRFDAAIGSIEGGLATKEVLATDASVAAEVLRMANSIYYGGIEPIAGLGRALARVGQRNVADYLRRSYRDRVDQPRECTDYVLRGFWRESLLVGCAAEEIARQMRLPNPDAVFSAGVLHDIGKLFLVRYFTEHFLAAQEEAESSGSALAAEMEAESAERAVLGIGHGLVGYELMRRWGLPMAVSAGALHHAADHPDTRRLKEARIVVAVALAVLFDAATLRSGMSLSEVLSEGDRFIPNGLPEWAVSAIKRYRLSVPRTLAMAARKATPAAEAVGLDLQLTIGSSQ